MSREGPALPCTIHHAVFRGGIAPEVSLRTSPGLISGILSEVINVTSLSGPALVLIQQLQHCSSSVLMLKGASSRYRAQSRERRSRPGQGKLAPASWWADDDRAGRSRLEHVTQGLDHLLGGR
ncbi:MAG TPA: hypothetical protein VK039_11615, partial [Brevibacterium sp.]|nr:hypothetical protein [Brevibacterium sp.]